MKAAVVVVVDMAAVGCSARRAGDARAAAALAVRFWRGLSDAAGAAAAELRNRVPCILLETMKKFTHTQKKKRNKKRGHSGCCKIRSLFNKWK